MFPYNPYSILLWNPSCCGCFLTDDRCKHPLKNWIMTLFTPKKLYPSPLYFWREGMYPQLNQDTIVYFIVTEMCF